jgi:hypothetical protein
MLLRLLAGSFLVKEQLENKNNNDNNRSNNSSNVNHNNLLKAQGKTRFVDTKPQDGLGGCCLAFNPTG